MPAFFWEEDQETQAPVLAILNDSVSLRSMRGEQCHESKSRLIIWGMVGLMAGCVAPEIGPTTELANAVVPAEESVSVDAGPVPAAELEWTEHSVVTPGSALVRNGDQIVVAGQLFRTGNPMVLWMDENGYDGYRVERRYSVLAEADWKTSQSVNRALTTPNRYSLRSATLTPAEREARRSGNWSLSELQEVVDQLILHYDVSGTSRQCFERLHDHRGSSIHSMVDADGTIYQTLDLKEKAWHATFANSRSIGIEIAHMGAYPDPKHAVLERWDEATESGDVKLTIPDEAHPDSVRDPGYSAQPARSHMVSGEINGQELW